MTTRSPGWRIGHLSGVPVYLGRSWFVIAIVMVVLFGPVMSRLVPEIGNWAYLLAVTFALTLLVSVLAHEAAHALVAQRAGFRVHRIVADFWGGHTAHDGADGTPGSSAAVAIAGPAANAALALLAWLVLWAGGATGPAPTTAGSTPMVIVLVLANAVMWANVFVAVFNLIPGLPLDGGFLLEALVWKLSGNRYLGTMVAGWFGRLVVVLVGIYLLFPMLTGQGGSGVLLIGVLLMGFFLWQGASRAIAQGRQGVRASRRRVDDAAVRAGVARATDTVGEVPWGRYPLWVVTREDGRPAGVVDPPALERVPAEARASTPVSALAIQLPAGWAVRMAPGERLDRVIDVMRTTGSGIIGLLDEEGRAWGVVIADDVAGERRAG